MNRVTASRLVKAGILISGAAASLWLDAGPVSLPMWSEEEWRKR